MAHQNPASPVGPNIPMHTIPPISPNAPTRPAPVAPPTTFVRPMPSTQPASNIHPVRPIQPVPATGPAPPRRFSLAWFRKIGKRQTSNLPITQTRQKISVKRLLKRARPWRRPSLPEPIVRVFRNWWLELLGSILVILSFSGLVAILRDYQGKPLPNWPLGLSLNTALSVFGAVFRAPALFIAAEGIGQLKWLWLSKRRPLCDLMAYDEATRGPWGATKLLWVARWRDVFAFLGAFITVASLGIDPFTQAVVSFYPCNITQNDVLSSISRTNSLFSLGLGYTIPTSDRLALDASFGNPMSIVPSFSCAADSCSFPKSYHTIGICSKCIDVTHELQTICKPGIRGGCSYTLSRPYPNGLIVNTTASYTISPFLGGNGKSNSTYANWQAFSVRKYKDIAGPDGIMVGSKTNGTSPDYRSSSIDIVSAWPVLGCRCQLDYCVRSYTSVVNHGMLKEVLQSTSLNWSSYTSETPILGTVNLDCLNPKVRDHLSSRGYTTSSTEWMAWNGTFANGTEAQERISGSSDLAIPLICVYQLQLINNILGWSPNEYFSDPLRGSLNGTGFDNSIDLSPDSSSLLTGLYNNGTVSIDSLSRAFDNFTSAATNYMRTLNSPIPKNITQYRTITSSYTVPLNPIRGDPEGWNNPVTGISFVDMTCINVRWAWLALPTAIFVGTLVFLVMLVAKTAFDRENEVWKSSQNALIWHGLDGAAESESVTLSTTKQMDSRAKGIEVRLKKTRKGWKLVQDG